jgi:Na+/phosphate symporter
MVNVLWALLNFVIGYFLFRAGKVSTGGDLALAIFFAGIVAISIQLSTHFTKKHTQ